MRMFDLREAFAPRFGHVPVFGAEHLHEPFREYADWIREHQLGIDQTKSYVNEADRPVPILSYGEAIREVIA